MAAKAYLGGCGETGKPKPCRRCESNGWCICETCAAKAIAQAITEAEKRGREMERAAFVDWLRSIGHENLMHRARDGAHITAPPPEPER